MVNGTAAPNIFPVVTVEEISDPAATKEGIELIDQETVQLQSIPLRARRVTVRLEGAAVVYHSSNQRAHLHQRPRRPDRLRGLRFAGQWIGERFADPPRPDPGR
jgi:hypothetical protein